LDFGNNKHREARCTFYNINFIKHFSFIITLSNMSNSRVGRRAWRTTEFGVLGGTHTHTHTHTLLQRQRNLHFHHKIYFLSKYNTPISKSAYVTYGKLTSVLRETNLINVWKCSRKLNSESWPWKRSGSLKQWFTLTSKSTSYYWNPLSFWRCSSVQGNHA
jgi:hypothetical protein